MEKGRADAQSKEKKEEEESSEYFSWRFSYIMNCEYDSQNNRKRNIHNFPRNF